MVTSGGMECLDLLCRSLLDAGDDVAVEGPTYLGAIMGFRDYGARLTGVPMDAEGLEVAWLRERLESGYRPKFLYTIPEFQNPSGRTLTLERRRALVELCREYGVLIVEDVAYKELSFDGSQLPSLWALAPDVVVQAGTFSKVFCPGTRLGWAVGPAALIAQLSSAKGGTDQCAGALSQRLVEEYGRAGHFGRRLPHARALYESHWVALSAALARHMPDGVAWSEPTGGMFTWLRMPEGLDARELRPSATEAGVAYVPGSPFYVDGGGANEMRLSFSSLDEAQLGIAAERLAGVIHGAAARVDLDGDQEPRAPRRTARVVRERRRRRRAAARAGDEDEAAAEEDDPDAEEEEANTPAAGPKPARVTARQQEQRPAPQRPRERTGRTPGRRRPRADDAGLAPSAA